MHTTSQPQEHLPRLQRNIPPADEESVQSLRAALSEAEHDYLLLTASGHFCEGAMAGATAQALKQELERLEG